MATENKSEFTIISATNTTVEDTTGNYDVVDNPGGWGAPNDEFTDYAHYLTAYKKNVNNVADERLVYADPDPITSLVWVIPRATDGWYYVKHYHIIIWTSGISFVAGEACYYNGGIYLALADNTNSQPDVSPADWTIKPAAEDVDSATNTLTSEADIVFGYNADLYYGNQIGDNAVEGRNGVCTDQEEEDKLREIEFHINALYSACQKQKFTDAEWSSLKLIELCAK
ncbi:hypothetical protein LCGC14_0641680 [marine sediment metagenome]|uniref:Uncharacterized protein n=1 Tax=marine sediment metagenome TaxID=412755 RepID=A0A0F9QYY4_9ZZZZ|nr:hypothetical protein [Candidatus Aminicenantes bacterium]